MAIRQNTGWILAAIALVGASAVFGATRPLSTFQINVPTLSEVSSANVSVISRIPLNIPAPVTQTVQTAHGKKVIAKLITWIPSKSDEVDKQLPPSVTNSGIILNILLRDGHNIVITPAEDIKHDHNAVVWHHPSGMVDIQYSDNPNNILRVYSPSLDNWFLNGDWQKDMV